MKQTATSKIIFASVLLIGAFLWTIPAHAAVLNTITGTFTSTDGDSAHNFKTLEDKLDATLPQLYKGGHNPKITSLVVNIEKQGTTFTTTYTATIEESSDGKAWMGFTSRGSFGNTPSAKCPAIAAKQNYEIRADGQISGCENVDGKSLEEKLKTDLKAGDIETVSIYVNPTILVKEYFVQFTKPATYPPQPAQPSSGGLGQVGTRATPEDKQYGLSTAAGGGAGTCSDRIDNDRDGRIDWNGGVDASGESVPPDPSCINAKSEEVSDSVTGSRQPLIPCINKCDLGSGIQLVNNIITFLIKVVLFPIVIIMFIYMGYQYITSGGKPGMHAKLRSMIWKLILGMLIVLCAWLIVKTLLVVLGYTDTLYFFSNG